MASIYKRKLKNGKIAWRAVVRLQGYPVICKTYERKQEAEDWGVITERQIRQGKFNFDQHGQKYTYACVIDRYIQDGSLEHHSSKQDTLRHLEYWRQRLGDYELVHLTTDRIGKERRLLAESPSISGKLRTPATINRYMASLSATLSYAARQLQWINDNPCLRLKKLKEHSGRDRVLTEEEIGKLLVSCRQSHSSYLYCIVLIALTTGARQSEILNLEWRDIDFDNRLAHLRETKNGRPRSVSLAEPVIEELQKIYAMRHPLKSLVFASKTAFGRVDVKKAWQHALQRAGITNCRAHDMRHTFATLAAKQGASNLELATALGHRTLEMLQRYTHLEGQIMKKFSDPICKTILQREANGSK